MSTPSSFDIPGNDTCSPSGSEFNQDSAVGMTFPTLLPSSPECLSAGAGAGTGPVLNPFTPPVPSRTGSSTSIPQRRPSDRQARPRPRDDLSVGSLLISPTPSPFSPVSVPAPLHSPSPSWKPIPSRAHPWLSDVLRHIVPSTATPDRAEIKILSHALPSPTPSAHAFPSLVSSLQKYPFASPPWIHVFHALPPSFDLTDLSKATSSDVDPASGTGQNSRLNTRIFDVAVPIVGPPSSPSLPSYHDQFAKSAFRHPGPPPVPASSRACANPIVPPDSVHFAVLERYIPPSSTAESSTLFSPTGPSLLTDRLTELSPEGGIALFVYPTRTGGTTFMRSHLGPALDPILRSFAVVYGFAPELLASVGRMPSVETLPEFDAMEASIANLCSQLSTPTKDKGGSLDGRFESDRSREMACQSVTYETLLALKTRVSLDPAVWPEQWWALQEQERIKSLFRAYIPTSGTSAWQTRPAYGASGGGSFGDANTGTGTHNRAGSTSALSSPTSASGSSTAPLGGAANAPPYSSSSTSSSFLSRPSVNHRSSLHESIVTPTILTHEIINGLVNRIRNRSRTVPTSPGPGLSWTTPSCPSSSSSSSSMTVGASLPSPSGGYGGGAAGWGSGGGRSRIGTGLDEQVEVGVFVIRKTAV